MTEQGKRSNIMRMSERGLFQAAKFTWERTASETVAVYQQVCG